MSLLRPEHTCSSSEFRIPSSVPSGDSGGCHIAQRHFQPQMTNPAAHGWENAPAPRAHLLISLCLPLSWNSLGSSTCGHTCPGYWMRPAACPHPQVTSPSTFQNPLVRISAPGFSISSSQPCNMASLYLFHRRRNRGSRRSCRLPELTSTKQMWQI